MTMRFISKSKLNAINKELDYLRNWKSVTEALEDATYARLTGVEHDFDQIFDFVQFLSKNVPDYEGYVLQYMDEQEHKDATDSAG